MAADWTQNLKLLKLLVAALTTLLAVGLVLLVYGMARTGKRMSERAAAEPRILTLPAGAEVLQSHLDGERALLRLRLDGREVLQVVDLTTGKVVRQLTLEPDR